MDVQIGASKEGALIIARVQPHSRTPGLAVKESGLLIRVSARPVKGRATTEARHVLAEALGVAPTTVVVRAGERSRSKVFLVRGLGSADASKRLTDFLG